MKQQTVNHRELYKTQKLQQIDQIYYCQCGKNYLTFAALYLHSRNKHDIKLTTKRTTSNCKIEVAQGKTKITYFIRQKQQQSLQLQVIQNLQSQRSNQYLLIKNAFRFKLWKTIEKYLNQENSPINGSIPIMKEVMQKLKSYLQQIQKINEILFPQKLQDIAFYFNEFIIYYLAELYAQGLILRQIIQGAAEILIKFWSWLKKKQPITLGLLYRQSSKGPYCFEN